VNLLSSPLARAGALLLPLALIACGDKAAETKPAPKPALTVTTVVPTQAMLPVTLAANGNLAAWQEAIIGAEASGLRIA
jgi:multidrug efflux pump subunit AcrA (membrane-fusion protein)